MHDMMRQFQQVCSKGASSLPSASRAEVHGVPAGNILIPALYVASLRRTRSARTKEAIPMSSAPRSSWRHELPRFLVGLAVFWLAVAAVYLVVRHRAPANQPPSAEMLSHRPADGDALPVLWSAPTFRFPDQDAEPVSDTSLRGHVWIADFFYSQCTTVCPLLTAQFVQLQREIASPERQLQRQELYQVLQQAIAELPEELRTALLLREFDGLSYDDIARVLDCPIGTVRSRIFRAREAVDRRIAPLLENGG